MKRRALASVVASLFFAVNTAFAGITVGAVKGEAALKQGRNWIPLANGQPIAEGSVISTGANSWVTLKIDAHVVTLKPLTTIKIFRNQTAGNYNNTNIGLKHGGVRAKVNRMGKVKTSFNIATPVATSSVRGTEQEVSYGPSTGMKVDIIQGVVRVHNQSGVSKTVQGNLGFTQKEGSPRSENPIAEVKSEAVVQVVPEGLSSEEVESTSNSTEIVPTEVKEVVNTVTNAKININLVWP